MTTFDLVLDVCDAFGRPLSEPNTSFLDETPSLCRSSDRRLWMRPFLLGKKAFSQLAAALRMRHPCFAPIVQIRFQGQVVLLQMVVDEDWRPIQAGDGCALAAIDRHHLVADLYRLTLWLQEQGVSPLGAQLLFGRQQHRLCCLGAETLPWDRRVVPAEPDPVLPILQGCYRAWFTQILRCWFSPSDRVPISVNDERQGLLMRVLRADLSDEVLWRELGDHFSRVRPFAGHSVTGRTNNDGPREQRRRAGLDALAQRLVQLRLRCALGSRLCVLTTGHRWAAVAAIFTAACDTKTGGGPLLWLDSGGVSMAAGSLRHRLQIRLRAMLFDLGERPDQTMRLRQLIAGLAQVLAKNAQTLTLIVTASGVDGARGQQRVLQLFQRIFQRGLCVIVLTPRWHHAGVCFLSRLWPDDRVFDGLGAAFDDALGRQLTDLDWGRLPTPAQQLWAALALLPEGLPSKAAVDLFGEECAVAYRFLAERELLRRERKVSPESIADDVAACEVWIGRAPLMQADNSAIRSMKEVVRPRLAAWCEGAGETDPWLRLRLFPGRPETRGYQSYLTQAVLALLRGWDWRAVASKDVLVTDAESERGVMGSALVALMRGVPQRGGDHLVPGLGGLRRGLQALYEKRDQAAHQAFERLAGSKKAPAAIRAYALVLAAEQAGDAGKPGRALTCQVRFQQQFQACQLSDANRLWQDRVTAACWLAHFYADGTRPGPTVRDGEPQHLVGFEPGARWRAAVTAFCCGDHLTALDHALWLLHHPDLVGDWTLWFAVTRFAADRYHSLNEAAGAAAVLTRGLQQALAFGLTETAHALASAKAFHLCGDGRFTAAQALFLAFPKRPAGKNDEALGRREQNRRLLFNAPMEHEVSLEKCSPARVNAELISCKTHLLSLPRVSAAVEKRLWRRVAVLLTAPSLTAAAAADHAAGFLWLAGWAALVGGAPASQAVLPLLVETLARRPHRGGFWRRALADLGGNPTSAWPEALKQWCDQDASAGDSPDALGLGGFWRHDPSADRVLWFLAVTTAELKLEPCPFRQARVRAFQEHVGVPLKMDFKATLSAGDAGLPDALQGEIEAVSARLSGSDPVPLGSIVRVVNQVLTQLLLATGAAEYGAFYWNPLDRETAWSVPAWLAPKPKSTSWQDAVYGWFAGELTTPNPESHHSYSREIARFRTESATIESAGMTITEVSINRSDRLVLWLIHGDSAAAALHGTGAALQAFAEATAAWWPRLYELFEVDPAAVSPAGFGMVGRCAGLQKVVQTVKQYGPSNLPVFIGGETGTGKELAARAVHLASSRAGSIFLAVNCSQYPENLIESHLFGFRQGSFTDAREDRPGLLEHADGGTLFLDEIADISAKTQSLLLRVLQEGVFTRVGCHQSRQVDVRIVTATNVDLAERVQSGLFRVDLYYRIMGARVQLPPLRERVQDIALLLAHFFKKHGDGGVPRWAPAFLAALHRHPWPGNIRELEMYVRRLIAAHPQVSCLKLNHLLPFLSLDQTALPTEALPTLKQWETNNRAHLLRERLAAFGGNRSAAADSLGISRQHLVHLLKMTRAQGEPAPVTLKK